MRCYMTNARTTEPKSLLSDTVVRDWLYSVSYAKSTMCKFIRWECLPITFPLFKEVNIYDDRKNFLAENKVQSQTWAPILRHYRRNNVKHSWKYSRALAGNQPRAALVHDQCSNLWAKELTLRLTQLSEIDHILEAIRNLRFVDIYGESACP